MTSFVQSPLLHGLTSWTYLIYVPWRIWSSVFLSCVQGAIHQTYALHKGRTAACTISVEDRQGHLGGACAHIWHLQGVHKPVLGLDWPVLSCSCCCADAGLLLLLLLLLL